MPDFPALLLQPQTFNPAGMLQAGAQIQDMRTRGELAQFNLASARERQEALRAFGEAGGISNPGALRRLAHLPDLYSQALTGMNAQQQMFALQNARAAQRVLSLRVGTQERLDAWREELGRARSEGRINDHLYNRYIAMPPDDKTLNDIIDLATPLQGGLNQRQILSLFGFGGNEDTAAPPPPNAPPPPLRNLTDVPGITVDNGNLTPPPPTVNGVTVVDPNREVPGGNLDFLSDRMSGLNFYQPPQLPPPVTYPETNYRPADSERELRRLRGIRDSLVAMGRNTDRVDAQIRRIEDQTGVAAPPGNPGGLLASVNPRQLAEISRQQVLPPNALPPDDFSRALAESTERITPPPPTSEPPPAAPPPGRQPPTSGPTGGLQGLRGAIQNMSQEQRLAAMLLMLKGEYGELAKMIQGHQGTAEQAEAQARGRARGEAQAALPQALQAGQSMIENIDAIIADPNIGNITGWQQWGPFRWLPYSPSGHTSLARVEQVQGQAFLQAYQALRGAGQISEAEGKKAQEAVTRLGNLQQDDAGYMEALRDARREIWDLMNLAREKAGQRRLPYTPNINLEQPGGTQDVRPDAQGWITLPNGVRFRER